MKDFERQAKLMRHEKRYMEKGRKDRNMQIDDNTKRSKQAYNLEFDDYRKAKGSTSRKKPEQIVKKKKLRHIIEEEGSESP